MKIQKLPAEAVTKLQSGIVITDAAQCVLELVYNSLDAKATAIAVRVDLKNYKIQVVDNGEGISKPALESVGEKFMTTKYHSFINSDFFTTYGFKGQTLSSLLDVCKILRIETKSKNNETTIVKVFENKISSDIIECVKNCDVMEGTTVTIEDFMYSMPVRRRRINDIFDLEEIKFLLRYLAIIHNNVSFTLRNENKCLILFQVQSAPSVLESFKNIFGANHAKGLKIVNLRHKNYKITGFISIKPQIQCILQAFYVNKRFVTKGVIHKLVNDIICNCIKAKTILSSDSVGKKIIKSALHAKNHVFVLEINCPNSYYELFGTSKKCTVEFKVWKDVMKCIEKAVRNVFSYNDTFENRPSKQPKRDKKGTKMDVKEKKGTSLLINVLKGEPAQRNQKKKGSNTGRVNHSPAKFDFSIFNEIMEEYDVVEDSGKQSTKSLALTNTSHHDGTIDSLESPIPKKRKKKNVQSCHLQTQNLNSEMDDQFFSQFTQWLMKNIKTNVTAHNFYKSFLHYKQKPDKIMDSSAPKNPVVGFDFTRSINRPDDTYVVTEGKTMKTKSLVSDISNDMCLKFENQNLELFFSSKKKKQSSPLCQFDLRESVLNDKNMKENSSPSSQYSSGERLICAQEISTHRTELWEKKIDNAFESPEQSELIFTNFMNLRNLTESCNSQSLFTPQEKNSGVKDSTRSWASHYKNHVDTEMENRMDVDEGLKPVETQKIHNYPEEDYGEKSNVECLNNSMFVATCSVGIQQPDISVNVTFQKKDVMVQTELSYTPKIGNENACVGNYLHYPWVSESVPVAVEAPECSNMKKQNENDIFNSKPLLFDRGLQWSADVTNEDADCADLFNSLHEDQIKKTMPLLTLKNSEINRSNEKWKAATDSSGIICCSQKVGLVEKNRTSSSASKDTIGAVWSDCLTRLNNRTENSLEMIDQILNNSKSSSTPVTQTVPIEEIDCTSISNIQQSFILTSRHDFMPKGLSPKFQILKTAHVGSLSPRKKNEIATAVENAEAEFLRIVKWQDESTGGHTKPVISDGLIDEMKRKVGKEMTVCESEIPSASLSFCAIKVHNLLHSFAFTKELLSTVEVIGQLDKKFIVGKMNASVNKEGELIILFDQHAADERVKLEELLNDYVKADGNILSTSLCPAIEFELKESLFSVILYSGDKLSNLGVKFRAIAEKTLEIQAIPKFLADKYAKEIKSKNYASIISVLELLIGNVFEEVTETRGALSQMPKVLYNLFCSAACHGAIKFNQSLTVTQMSDLINKLKNCKLPFQCAHGRPSVIPLIDLEDFKDQNEKREINLDKLKNLYASHYRGVKF